MSWPSRARPVGPLETVFLPTQCACRVQELLPLHWQPGSLERYARRTSAPIQHLVTVPTQREGRKKTG